MTPKKPTPTGVELPPMRLQRIDITLIGDTPLLCHAWSDKVRRMMLAKQMKEAQPAKEAKDPAADFADSLYWMSERPNEITPDSIAAARFGFPAVAFKSAAVDACSYVSGVTKVAARGSFHILANLVPINGKGPEIDERMVRVGMGTADIRYRARFDVWRVTLPVRFDESVLGRSQLVQLFDRAGFSVGVGDYRPQRDGSCGLFHVARPNEMEAAA